MRIIAGAHRGRLLVAPKGHQTRPTADRTRQALFDVLEHAPWSPGLAGLRVLDVFAGSGALGLESLSRGAARGAFIDNAPAAVAATTANLRALGLSSEAVVITADATRLGPRPAGEARFDLAFLDPPYGGGLVGSALAALASGEWLSGGALISVEQDAGEPPLRIGGFLPVEVREWGRARITVLRPG